MLEVTRKEFKKDPVFRKPLQPVRVYTDLSEGIDLISE